MSTYYPYVIFSPYFGKLPNYFDLWAQSCGQNPQFLFLVFTDDKYEDALPKNVQLKSMSFDVLRNLVQSKFDFPISLQSPYKLCDYRPAFGYIFQDYLNNCSYWGYCDMDLIFGNISKFLPQQDYDKISHLGHLCLYRNTSTITQAFKLRGSHVVNYKNIFSSPTHFAFDEDEGYGINTIFRVHQLSIYPFEKTIADVGCLNPNFPLAHYQNPGLSVELGMRVFSVEGGRVYSHTLDGNDIKSKEYAYVHMQKRRMERKFNGTPVQYLITPMGFEPWQTISDNLISSRQKRVSGLKQLLHKLLIKRISSPRALRRKIVTTKIIYQHKLKRTKTA